MRAATTIALLLAAAGCAEDPFADRVCRVNGDCAPGETCVSGDCRGEAAPEGCTSDLECGAGEACDLATGRCERFAPLACGRDEDCGADERCDLGAGVCVEGARACLDDDDCAALDRRCDPTRQRCVECLDAADCPGGTACADGSCEPIGPGQCRTDSECAPPSTVCEGERCVPGCDQPRTPLVCGPDEVCRRGSGRCGAAPPPGCSTDADCAPPRTVCEGGACVAGCLDAGCPDDETCGALTGRCEPPALGELSDACSDDADCRSGLCFELGSVVGRRCIQACGSHLDCPVGFACADYLGAKTCIAARFFEDATFSAGDGSACSAGGECRSGYCGDGARCVGTCAESADCAGADGCRWTPVTGETYLAACTGTGPGAGRTGDRCAVDADCAEGVCYGDGICADLCGSTADCPSGTVCAPVDYSVCPSATSPCTQWQVNLVKACVQAPAGALGNVPLGGPCAVGSDCRDAFCDTAAGQCVGTCSTDADCAAGQRCGIEAYGRLGQQTVYFNVCLVP